MPLDFVWLNHFRYIYSTLYAYVVYVYIEWASHEIPANIYIYSK